MSNVKKIKPTPEEREARKRKQAFERKRNRALAPVIVSVILRVKVIELANKMREHGITTKLTDVEARKWINDPSTAPYWLMEIWGERLARDAKCEYRRQQALENTKLRVLAAEQSALNKVRARKRRFTNLEWDFLEGFALNAAKELMRGGVASVTDEEKYVLNLFDVKANDHSAWPLHFDNCDGEGKAHCSERVTQLNSSD